MPDLTPPVFRFAPSPNGHLHLGHAYSALFNQQMCREYDGEFLLRIEDIDRTRCTPELEEEMLEDLRWLGISWQGEPRRQSDHFEDYASALETLREAGLVYPSFMTRGEVKRAISDLRDKGECWPTDPDGSPLYPGDERGWSVDAQQRELQANPKHIWRLNMKAALDHVAGDIAWVETGSGSDGETGDCLADPSAWGDVVLARADTPTSYHLSVVLDDAAQGISHVVRGCDLFHATAVHRVLQILLGLPAPIYHHHDLILREDGRKLSKSAQDTSLRSLRQSGMTPDDIKRMVGFSARFV